MSWLRNATLRFRCTKCGDCCRREGWVYMTRDEAELIAVRLRGSGATPEGLIGTLWEEEPTGDFSIEVRGSAGCPLLGPEGCTINDIKPAQCGTYPFWGELLGSRRDWDAERKLCEGIGPDGDEYRFEDIVEMLHERAHTKR